MILLLFCRQSPCCDLTRCYRLLYFVFFTLPKGFNSGEYTFYSIQAPSNSIHHVLGKYPHILRSFPQNIGVRMTKIKLPKKPS